MSATGKEIGVTLAGTNAAPSPGAVPGHHSLGRYWRKVASREAIRAMIARLVRWEALRDPADGYTVIIGCSHRLAPMLDANLRTLERQAMRSCERVLVVLDCAREELGGDPEARWRAAAPGVRLEFLYYDARQRRVARRIDWGWVYSWMSWSLGLARTRTRYAILHDFDALLLRPGLLDERYHAIRERGVEYLGVGNYVGLGVAPEDGLVKTFELILDAAFVRERFRPIDLFNKMASFRGRRVEFDTFLHAQSRGGRTGVLEIPEQDMVHPSQMICQFVDFVSDRKRMPVTNNLLMIPYYESLGGDERLLADVAAQLRAAGSGGAPGGRVVRLWGRDLGVGELRRSHALWMQKQGLRLEASLLGSARPSVVEYFDLIVRAAGGEG